MRAVGDLQRRHLACIVAIAEHGSITAAAASIPTSQSAMSRTLAQLEAIVGEHLVERSTHHLVLTRAGERLVGPARDAIAALDQALAAARNVDRPLRFGHSWATSDRAAELTRRWRERPDRCEVQLVFCEERLAGIERGVCDVALGRGSADSKRFRTVEIAREARFGVVPSDHRLARRRTLHLADLAAERIVVSTLGTTTAELWPVDRRPTEFLWAPSTEEWLTAIAAGSGVGVTVESVVASRQRSDIRYLPLVDAEPVPLVLVAPRQATHAATGSFVRAAQIQGPSGGAAEPSAARTPASARPDR